MKSKVDKLDVDKLKHVSVDLKKKGHVVEKKVFRKSKPDIDKQGL